MERFWINPLAIIFLEEIDRENGYETIACDWEKEEFIKINSSAYKILRAIDNTPGISLLELSKTFPQNDSRLEKFLKKMVEKNMVLLR